MLQAIVELPEFIKKARALFTENETKALIDHLAEHPNAGDLMQGTGGVRKLRWAREGRGKSGGARVIYYFHSERIPLYLLTAFGKGEKANLSPAERSELADLVQILKRTALREKGETS
jgi:hypothetical protein